MKILEFQYSDREIDWHVDPIKFSNLTLLVGASGVGKTRILKAIKEVKNITLGESLNGVSWKISFSIDSDIYTWEGEFELIKNAALISISKNGNSNDSQSKKPSIIFEKMVVNEKVIVERKKTEIIFKGDKSPIPIKAEQSVLSLIPDPIIKKAEQGFKKIFYNDCTNSVKGTDGNVDFIDKQILKQYDNIDRVRNSNENLTTKLFWAYKKDKDIFDNIKDDFIAVFPQVIDLKIEPLDVFKDADVPLFLKAAPFIQFREDKARKWIPVMGGGMSAGMYRTLIHIIELNLSANGTIILIDEFENSLGVNCIDELTTEIKGAIHRIQFIITSHHPYIINNISYNNWKIVTRDGSTVSTQDAKEFNFAKSKHEAFIQLLNLPSYKTGKRQ